MRKKLFLAAFLAFCGIECQAQVSYSVAKNLGDNLHMWCETQDETYRIEMEQDLKDPQPRVENTLCKRLAYRNNKSPKGDYLMDTYANWIGSAIPQGLRINMSNYQMVSKIKAKGKRARKVIKKQGFEFISCSVNTTGPVDLNSKDLLYVKQGKIARIADYEEEGGYVKVDMSDFLTQQTFGANYNYSKDWPIGLSLTYSYGMLMVSLDGGYNTSKDKFYTHKLNMTDVMNFTKTDNELDPKFYVTLSPQFFYKYFSVGCGFGGMFMSNNEDKYVMSSTTTTTTSETSNGSSTHIDINDKSNSSSESKEKVKFMIRPTVKGFIPVSKAWYITVSAAYDYAFGFKEYNGIDFGIGAQFVIP